MGRLVPGPNVRLATPGSFCRTSAIVALSRLAMSTESRLVTALNASKVVAAPRTLAVTWTSSCTFANASLNSTVEDFSAVTDTDCLAAARCSRCASTSYVPGGTLVISNVPSVLGGHRPARTDDDDRGAVNGITSRLERHFAGDGAARGLGEYGASAGCQDRESGQQSDAEQCAIHESNPPFDNCRSRTNVDNERSRLRRERCESIGERWRTHVSPPRVTASDWAAWRCD